MQGEAHHAEAAIARALDAADRINPSINAVLWLDREAKAGVGPLGGVPVLVKDCIDWQGRPTTHGSAVYRDAPPAAGDAEVVRRLRDAGATLIGKSHLSEFCFGATGENATFGNCRNPWDTARITGGSSSGSAAAVGAGIVPAAIGTDTGGSVRVPAALCGVVGLRPTLGRVSNSRACWMSARSAMWSGHSAPPWRMPRGCMRPLPAMIRAIPCLSRTRRRCWKEWTPM